MIDKIGIIVIMLPIMIDDLSQIGRPATARIDAVRASAGEYDALAQGFERGERSRINFEARGSAQPLEKAQFGQGNPRVFL
jgi:hypothetical protein